jgi:hypothetical protein
MLSTLQEDTKRWFGVGQQRWSANGAQCQNLTEHRAVLLLELMVDVRYEIHDDGAVDGRMTIDMDDSMKVDVGPSC